MKDNMKHVIKANQVTGKRAMKICASVCQETKNESVRVGGIAPAQWVLGRFPRGVGHMLEEEELGQLGVLEELHGADASTEFALKAKYRLESQKAFVKQVTGIHSIQQCREHLSWKWSIRVYTHIADTTCKQIWQNDTVMY